MLNEPVDSHTNIRVSLLEGRVYALDQPVPAATVATSLISMGGPTFLDPPIIIYDSGAGGTTPTGPVALTTFDTKPYTKKVASCAIIECEGAMQDPDDPTPVIDAYIYLHKSGATSRSVGLRGRSSGLQDNVAWAKETTLPLSNGLLDYEIITPGFGHGAIIRLMGYF